MNNYQAPDVEYISLATPLTEDIDGEMGIDSNIFPYCEY